LQELAAALEKAIREKQPPEDINAKLEAFTVPHAQMVAHLAEAFPASEAPQTVGSVDAEKVDVVNKKMTALLANDDSEAADYLETENGTLRYILGVDRFDEFAQAIKQYDFEKALELMSAVTKP